MDLNQIQDLYQKRKTNRKAPRHTNKQTYLSRSGGGTFFSHREFFFPTVGNFFFLAIGPLVFLNLKLFLHGLGLEKMVLGLGSPGFEKFEFGLISLKAHLY